MEDIVHAIEQTRRNSVIPPILMEDARPMFVEEVKIFPRKMIFSDAFDGKRFLQSLTITNCGKYPVFVRVLSPSSKYRMEDIVYVIEQTRHSIMPIKCEDIRPVVIDDVRVIPRKMVFSDAFDGKRFLQSFTVINCGKYPAFIRVLSPSSQTFQMKAVPKGVSLPSGMSLTRKISYTHTSALGLPHACLTVYINDKPIVYEIEVHLITSFVTLRPRVVVFGEVDVGSASKSMPIELKNIGRKMAHFAVDLGRHDLELIVEPMKGSIEPNETVEMRVEVLGSYLGTFNKEFWIKTSPPRRVNICGIFIPPKLVLEHPFTTFSIVMMDFPRTYFGAESVKTLVIHNSSSTDAMFCTVAECGKNYDYLNNVRAKSADLKSFFIKPKEGRLPSQKKHVLRYSFAPKKVSKFNHEYCIAFVKVMKVNYRDGVIVEKDVEVKTFPPIMDMAKYSVESLIHHNYDEHNLPEANFVRICLYGEMESASVNLTPSSMYLTNMKPHYACKSIVNIKNNSTFLPIIVKYNKQPCIEIEPRQIFLDPSQGIEVNLIIKPSKIGESGHKISFDLVYKCSDKYYTVGNAYLHVNYNANMMTPKIPIPKFNMGITPMLTNEVGYLVNDVRFNTIIDKPRQAIVSKNLECFNDENSALIAFPNDRPKSLRPWRNKVPTCTIFTNIPRLVNGLDEYTLNTYELEMKQRTRNIYSTYLQSAANTKQTFLPKNKTLDYNTDKNHLLLEGASYIEPITNVSTYERFNRHLPLPPEELMSVIVTPKHVLLGLIAPYTSCSDFFTIQNKNDYPIDVSIKALNNSVVIKEQKQMTIGAEMVKNIMFDCYSHGLGEYYVPVFIIINKCHIFNATVFAKVVPTTVKCSCKEIIIDPITNESIFEIFNPVNCDITFSFEVQDKNFKILPESGKISSRKALFCSVMFLLQKQAIIKTDIYLLSQSGSKKVIRATLDNKKACVGFHTDILKFDNIPLNTSVSKEVVLRNFSESKIMYIISNSNQFKEITVKPTEGKIDPKSEIHFQVTVHFKHVVEFNCSIEFILQDIHPYVVNIAGNVVFPKIKLEPKYIQIQKIVSGSFAKRVFRVTNVSEAQTFINFPMGNFSEFAITDLDRSPIKKPIILESNESRELYLEFNPIEPIAYSIYLPYIINGIIGPPALNDVQSTKPATYFTRMEDKFIVSSLPETLPTISIRCAAGARWLRFSSLNLYLFSYEGKRNKYFTITNISATEHRIIIPKIDSAYPLSFELEKSGNYKKKGRYYKLIIEPEEKVTFKIEFNPLDYGNYEIELPIYVTKYLENCPFNFLRLFASHPVPSITCNKKILCFQTIIVREKLHEKVTLNLVNHKDKCKIITKVNDDSISVKFLEKNVVTQRHFNVTYLITFDPKEECFVDCELTFNCTCYSQSSCSIFVKASADDSSFASYPSLLIRAATSLSMESKSTYPYFPKTTDVSFYATKMRVIQRNLEKWLFSQGFFYKNYYKIPYGLSSFPVDIHSQKHRSVTGKTGTGPILPLMQLLINLIDISILKYIGVNIDLTSFEDTKATKYVFTVYGNIINFLKTQLVFVPQLKPEYLLPYKSYILFKNNFVQDNKSDENIFTEEDFFLFSKQCWIDLLMRIYKVFVLERIVNPSTNPKPKSKFSQISIVHQEGFMKYYSENLHEITDRCQTEAKLLLWLEYHFEKQKLVLWNSENIKQPRKIRSFHNNLWDSLPFATLLVAYCPYMINDLQNFYPDYQNYEQIFHNACVITNAWKKMQLSCELGPSTIVNPLVLEMVLLAAYLYDVLPNFYPTETITFEASLGETAVTKILLKNQGAVSISYRAIFFPNDLDAFQVESKTIVILPKKEKKFKITYLAKSVLKKTAVLVLSGETPGYKFSKSMAMTLVGIPQIFNFSEEFEIKIDTFQKAKKKLDISSPYERGYQASTYWYLGDESVMHEDTSHFISVSSIVEKKIPRQIILETRSTFDECGDSVFNVTLCFITVGVFSYFIYFFNEEVGDFCIKLTINSVIEPESTVDLEVVTPLYFNPVLQCICNFCTCIKGVMNLNCPQVVSIKIPCRNSQLLNGLRQMLEICCGEDDFVFWEPLLEDSKGLHVLKMYMENTFAEKFITFKKILSPSVTYIVDDSPRFVCQKRVTIEHVFSRTSYMLPVHWVSKEIPEEGEFVMTADHGEEKRRYKLKFNIRNAPLRRSVVSGEGDLPDILPPKNEIVKNNKADEKKKTSSSDTISKGN